MVMSCNATYSLHNILPYPSVATLRMGHHTSQVSLMELPLQQAVRFATPSMPLARLDQELARMWVRLGMSRPLHFHQKGGAS